MAGESTELFRFGEFSLDVREHRLSCNGGVVTSLPEKSFQTLVHLLRNAGTLVRKRDLMAAVWPDTVVEENNLDKCIHAIRHSLNEKPGDDRFIETVRKHGYRFVGEVERSSVEKVSFGRVALGPTINYRAYEEYLRGRYDLGRFMFRTLLPEDCDKAIRRFMKATDIDPQFASAWSGLGACFANKILRGVGSRNDVAQAKTALKRALALDANIVEARVLTAWLRLSDGRKEQTRAELEDVLKEFPDTAAPYFLKAMIHRIDGEYDESIDSWRRVEQLDPSAIVICSCNRARIFSLQGDHDGALKELAVAENAEPNHPFIKLYRAQVLYSFGIFEEATTLMLSLLDENPYLFGVRPLLAALFAAQERNGEAYENLSENALTLAYVDCDIAYWTASAYALLGERKAAIEWLTYAVSIGFGEKKRVANDRSFSKMGADSRFIEELGRI